MAKFGKTSTSRLRQCHNDLQILFNEVVRHFDCSVICGHRSQPEQDEAFEKGFSKVKFPNSKHNQFPSLAVDVVPYPIDWNDTKRMIHFAGLVKGLSIKLIEEGKINHHIRWGGDWDSDTELKDNKFQDYPHFELLTKTK